MLSSQVEVETPREAGEGASPCVTPRAWWSLAVLTAAYSANNIDKMVVSIAAEPLKREFALSDKALGAAGGLFFALGFIIAAAPIGRLADRMSRKRLMVTLITLWSGFTMLGAAAANYVQLVLSRVAVGVAEAGASPTALSLIFDYIPSRRRTTAFSIFFLATPIGSLTAFALGGMIVAEHGWRTGFLLAGLPGLAIGAIIALTLREPPRTGAFAPAQDERPQRLIDSLREIAGVAALYPLIVVTSLVCLTMSAVLMWAASFLIRVHGLPLQQATFVVGIVVGVASSVGTLASGAISDRISLRARWKLLLVPTVGITLGLPAGLATALAPSAALSIAALCLTMVLMNTWMGPVFALAMESVSARCRGLTNAVFQAAANLIGVGLGPVVAGALSDYYGGPTSLRPAIATLFLLNIATVAALLVGMRMISRLGRAGVR